MIYTVTFNPSLDYMVSVNDFRLGAVNRSRCEKIRPGGKGINVSAVLRNLGVDTVAAGFVSGFTGDEIKRLVEEKGIKTDFIDVNNGMSRINVKLNTGVETEINGGGPQIGGNDIKNLYKKLDTLTCQDILVLSGSVPKDVSKSIYGEICEYLKERKIKIAVDASGELLTCCLSYEPFLIKPNRDEAEEIFKTEIRDMAEAAEYAVKLREAGAENVIISLGEKGAVFAASSGEVYGAAAPSGRVISAVGAGDSMVAGFIAGWLKEKNPEYAFRLGVSAGSACAFSDGLASEKGCFEVFRVAEVSRI